MLGDIAVNLFILSDIISHTYAHVPGVNGFYFTFIIRYFLLKLSVPREVSLILCNALQENQF